jgi:DNA repair protein RecN (Recombination protein N)
MLLELHLRNLAVVAEARLELEPGLVALTGETGAGKSIVVDALSLLAGARANSDVIRTGADSLSVTGVFRPDGERWREVLRELGLEAGGEELVIRREVSRAGRNRVFVDDVPTTVRTLLELAPHLIAIHGQGEEAALRSLEEQRLWLDGAGGAEAQALLARAEQCYGVWQEASARLERLQGDQSMRLQRLDLLRFQLQEIDAANPAAGEESALRQEREVLRHAEAILTALDRTRAALGEAETNALEQVGAAREALADISGWEPLAVGWLEQLDEALVRIEEVAMEVARRADRVEVDPGRLAGVEDRLAELERLMRKHGGSTEELLVRAAAMRAELAELEADASDREGVERRTVEALERYRLAADELSAARARWSRELAAEVQSELADLALARARFGVRLGVRPRQDSPLMHQGRAIDFGRDGYDVVELELAANPGEPLGSLSRVASGGELARVSLALRLAARRGGEAGGATLVFDEVDSGVGGGEAAALGLKLQRVAAGGQVLAVTHLPQVAACADQHLRVTKVVDGERTYVAVEHLGVDQRVEELARMGAGREVTEIARSHARELLVASARTAETVR